mgnify:FL=1
MKEEKPTALNNEPSKDPIKISKLDDTILNDIIESVVPETSLPQAIGEKYAYCCEAITLAAAKENMVFHENYLFLPKKNEWYEIEEHKF